MEFIAEVKRTSQVKKASLDNEFSVLFVTDNPLILDLGKLSSDTTVRVRVEINEQG